MTRPTLAGSGFHGGGPYPLNRKRLTLSRPGRHRGPDRLKRLIAERAELEMGPDRDCDTYAGPDRDHLFSISQTAPHLAVTAEEVPISPPPSCWKPRPTSDLAPARSERDLRESGPAAHAHRTRREQRRRGLPAVAWYRSYPLPTSLGKLCAGVRGAISVNEARSDNTVVASGTWGAWRCWAPKFALTWGPEITHRRVSRQLGRWNSRPRPMRAIYQNRGQYHPHERDSSR